MVSRTTRTRKGYTKQPSQRRISRSVADIPSPADIDPQSSCPPPPPNYSGDWYSNCLRELGIR